MGDMILLDGVKYCRYEPKTEAEFEHLVVENAAQIFGEDAIYLDIKKLIKTEWGKGTIPDGYLFYPEEKRFVLVEVELSSHDVHSHVSRQLATFIGSFENHRSRNKLAKLVQRHIEENPQLRERLGKAAKGKGLFDFLYNEVFEALAEGGGFETIVVIERETPQILGAMKLLMPHPKVLEVAIYAREGAEEEFALRFEPQYDFVTQPIMKTVKPAQKKPDKEETPVPVSIKESIVKIKGDLEFPIEISMTYKRVAYKALLYSHDLFRYNDLAFSSLTGLSKYISDGKKAVAWTAWDCNYKNAVVKISEIKDEIWEQGFYKSIQANVRSLTRRIIEDLKELERQNLLRYDTGSNYNYFYAPYGDDEFTVFRLELVSDMPKNYEEEEYENNSVSEFDCGPWSDDLIAVNQLTHISMDEWGFLINRYIKEFYLPIKDRLISSGLFSLLEEDDNSIEWYITPDNDFFDVETFIQIIADLLKEIKDKQ